MCEMTHLLRFGQRKSVEDMLRVRKPREAGRRLRRRLQGERPATGRRRNARGHSRHRRPRLTPSGLVPSREQVCSFTARA